MPSYIYKKDVDCVECCIDGLGLEDFSVTVTPVVAEEIKIDKEVAMTAYEKACIDERLRSIGWKFDSEIP